MKTMQTVAEWMLGIGLVLVTVVFSVPTHYGSAYWPIALSELVLIVVAAWLVAGNAVIGAHDMSRRLAAAGLLLVAPFALFSLLPGLGPPDSLGSNALEQRRFVLLLINALCVFGGCFLLRDLLVEEGERLFSGLAMAAASAAAPLYVVFTAIQLADYRDLDRRGLSPELQAFTVLDDVSIVMLFFGSVLNYLATIAFAQSLSGLGVLGRRARNIYVLVAAIMLCFLIFRGLGYGSLPKALQHWYTTVAFFAGVPAISWVLLSSLGVAVLSRAGRAPAAMAPVGNLEFPRRPAS
jgi:hypothetical protein